MLFYSHKGLVLLLIQTINGERWNLQFGDFEEERLEVLLQGQHGVGQFELIPQLGIVIGRALLGELPLQWRVALIYSIPHRKLYAMTIALAIDFWLVVAEYW